MFERGGTAVKYSDGCQGPRPSRYLRAITLHGQDDETSANYPQRSTPYETTRFIQVRRSSLALLSLSRDYRRVKYGHFLAEGQRNPS